MSLHIIETGLLALIEDLGRPGYAHLGVSQSGALDRGALRFANRLVGNDEGAAGIEIALGLLRARFDAPTWFAVTGAWGDITLVSADGSVSPVLVGSAHHAEAGDELVIGAAARGLRFYLAVRGGIAATPVLGSRSHDTLSHLGPTPIAAGDVIAIGAEPERKIPVSDAVGRWAPSDDTVVIDVIEGPRTELFDERARSLFFEQAWALSSASNRIGARLEGEPLPAGSAAELPSEGMVSGSIQVPPSGLPTILLADHPVTGGYPVIAVVADASLDALAQVRPGQRLRFRHAH